ncbi:MAG: hypothetical protein GF417_09985 [Candidatus Latescibacteria bacterium]|nr:hypothetical protein [Candidatus Latescibacterota bacterium]
MSSIQKSDSPKIEEGLKMKKVIAVLTVLLISLPVVGGERVTKVIESDIPIIIDGNWVYPEDGKFTLVLTDSVLTVNGYEYVHPPKKMKKHVVSKEKNFSEWVITKAGEKAQKEIDAGRGEETVQRVMDEFFKEHIGRRKSVTYKYDKKNKKFLVEEECDSVAISVYLPYLSTKEKMANRATWREKAVEGNAKNIITVYTTGRLLLRNTMKGYSRGYDPEKAIPVIRKIQKESSKYLEAESDTSICINGVEFSPIDIMTLTNPRKLVKRRFEDESD